VRRAVARWSVRLPALVLLCVAEARAADPAAAEPLTVDRCVEIAIGRNATIGEAEARVREYEARLAEVEALHYPRLWGMTFVAPMFTVHGDAVEGVTRDYSPDAWGPYTHLEATLAQPLYTFGRQAAGERASEARAQVERARLRQTRNAVALEVRKLYYLHLFALDLLPTLGEASHILDQAITEARKLYDAGTGEVSQVDLMKLENAAVEARKYQVQLTCGASLSLAALAQTMGLESTEALQLAGTALPPLPDASSEQDLASLLDKASHQRPEWEQLDFGQVATRAAEQVERKADLPVVFLAAQLEADWTPVRSDVTNPYQYDPYNKVVGGLALGLQYDLNPWSTRARGDAARATGEQVAALRRFASSGIPLQVAKAYADLGQARQLVDLSREGTKLTRKWVGSARTARETGTGDVRDLLEGLAAYLQARASLSTAIRDYHLARAELAYAVGE
jgi:outer membrane protein